MLGQRTLQHNLSALLGGIAAYTDYCVYQHTTRTLEKGLFPISCTNDQNK